MISDEQRGSASGSSGAPIAMRIKLRYRSIDEFVDEFAGNINRKGLFLASPRPRPVGTEVLVDLRLADDEPVVSCKGIVRWIRDGAGSAGGTGDRLSGMGIEILEADAETQRVLRQIERARIDLSLGDNDAIPHSPPGGRAARRNGRRPALSTAALLAQAAAEVSGEVSEEVSGHVGATTAADGDDDLARLLGDQSRGSEIDSILTRAKKLATSLTGSAGESSDIAELEALSGLSGSSSSPGGAAGKDELSSTAAAAELAALLGRAPVAPRRHRAPAKVELPPAAPPGRPAPQRPAAARPAPKRPVEIRPAPKPLAKTRPAPVPPPAPPASATPAARPGAATGRSETVVESSPAIPVQFTGDQVQDEFLERETAVTDRPEELAREVDRIGQEIDRRAEEQAALATGTGGAAGPDKLRLEPTEEELEEQLQQAQLVLEAALDDLAGSIEPSEEIVIGDDVASEMIIESQSAVASPEIASAVDSVPFSDPMGPDPDKTLMGEPMAALPDAVAVDMNEIEERTVMARPLPGARLPHEDRTMTARPISGPPRAGKSAADDIETAERPFDLDQLFGEDEDGLGDPLQDSFDDDEFDEQPTALVDRDAAVLEALDDLSGRAGRSPGGGAEDIAAIVREPVFDSVRASQEARRQQEEAESAEAAAADARGDSTPGGIDALVDSLSRDLDADALDADDLMASDLDALARSTPAKPRFGPPGFTAMEPGDPDEPEEYTLEPTMEPYGSSNDDEAGSPFEASDGPGRAFTEADVVSMDASESIMDVLDQLDPFAGEQGSGSGVATGGPPAGVDAALESLENDSVEPVELDMDDDIELIEDSELTADELGDGLPSVRPPRHPTPPIPPRPQRNTSPPLPASRPHHTSGPIPQVTPPPELADDSAVPQAIEPEKSGRKKRGFFRRIFNKEDS